MSGDAVQADAAPSAPMTDAELAEIERLVEAADLTPLEMSKTFDFNGDVVATLTDGTGVEARIYVEETADLIVAALNGLPRLVASLRIATDRGDLLRSALEDAHRNIPGVTEAANRVLAADKAGKLSPRHVDGMGRPAFCDEINEAMATARKLLHDADAELTDLRAELARAEQATAEARRAARKVSGSDSVLGNARRDLARFVEAREATTVELAQLPAGSALAWFVERANRATAWIGGLISMVEEQRVDMAQLMASEALAADVTAAPQDSLTVGPVSPANLASTAAATGAGYRSPNFDFTDADDITLLPSRWSSTNRGGHRPDTDVPAAATVPDQTEGEAPCATAKSARNADAESRKTTMAKVGMTTTSTSPSGNSDDVPAAADERDEALREQLHEDAEVLAQELAEEEFWRRHTWRPDGFCKVEGCAAERDHNIDDHRDPAPAVGGATAYTTGATT